MKNYKDILSKSIYSATALSMLLATTVSPSYADETRTTQYGGYVEEVFVGIRIDKKVRNPITGDFQENLGSGDATYSPGSEVVYSLRITNGGTKVLTDVKVTDVLPSKLTDAKVISTDLVKEESYNKSTNTLTFKLKDELIVRGARDVLVKATVLPLSAFPSAPNPFCEVVNTARVEAEGKSDEDTAGLCVQLQVLGKVSLPEAGIADYLPLLPFAVMSITGIALFLKKK